MNQLIIKSKVRGGLIVGLLMGIILLITALFLLFVFPGLAEGA